MNRFAEEIESRAIDSATGFHDRQNDGHVLAAGLFFGAEAELSKDYGLPQGLFSCVICRRDTVMMHKHEQTETLVAQATTRFRRLRLCQKTGLSMIP